MSLFWDLWRKSILVQWRGVALFDIVFCRSIGWITKVRSNVVLPPATSSQKENLVVIDLEQKKFRRTFPGRDTKSSKANVCAVKFNGREG